MQKRLAGLPVDSEEGLSQTAHAVLVWDVDRNEEVGASDVEGDSSAAGVTSSTCCNKGAWRTRTVARFTEYVDDLELSWRRGMASWLWGSAF